MTKYLNTILDLGAGRSGATLAKRKQKGEAPLGMTSSSRRQDRFGKGTVRWPPSQVYAACSQLANARVPPSYVSCRPRSTIFFLLFKENHQNFFGVICIFIDGIASVRWAWSKMLRGWKFPDSEWHRTSIECRVWEIQGPGRWTVQNRISARRPGSRSFHFQLWTGWGKLLIWAQLFVNLEVERILFLPNAGGLLFWYNFRLPSLI